MLRARHQAFLAQQRRQGCQRCYCRRKQKDPCGIKMMVMDGPLSSLGVVSSEGTHGVTTGIELCEEGNFDQAFARAAVSVVVIAEEGLFRSIILYL